MPDVSYYSDLMEWATPAETRYLEAIIAVDGNVRKAARDLGLHHSVVQRGVKRAKRRATTKGGYSPEHGLGRKIAPGFVARGHSTMDRINRNDPTDRTMLIQWTKTRLDDVAWLEQVQGGIEEFIAGLGNFDIKIPDGPLNAQSDVIPWIQIGDAHLGMLAHEAETGANFDLKIAERELLTAVGMLIDELPESDRIVIQDLGDFTHYENFAGKTEASGHDLDFDGRFPKMIDVYSRLMQAILDMALRKAQNVDVIINQGNHSRTNDIWMAVLLREVYKKTGRVNVLNNHSPFIGYRMGNTLVMSHHSDKTKPNKLAHVMTHDFRKDYGETEFHYVDIGHIHHHMRSVEHPSIVIESWNILAERDQYAHDNGYRSRQSISVVFRSKKYGEVGRRLLPIQQVRERIVEQCRSEGKPIPDMPQPLRAFTV